MNLGNINLNSISINRNLNKNSQTKISFGSESDVIEFSPGARENKEIVNELVELGYDMGTALRMLADYKGSDDYNQLTQGDPLDNGVSHSIEIDRHLTPAEALLYLKYNMGDYYMQYMNAFPISYEKGTLDSTSHDIGDFSFLPKDLAKYLLKGFDIVLSGMILKGTLSEKEAKDIKPYYELAQSDNYSKTCNVQQAEYAVSIIKSNLSKIRGWISDEKNESGSLKSGLERPLTQQEAVILVTNDYMPQDISALNNYIKYNKHRGYSLFDMASYDLWQKDFDTLTRREESTEPSNIRVLKTKRHYETLQELIDVLNRQTGFKYADFYKDVALLDNEKFKNVLSPKQLQFDAMLSVSQNREKRQENIRALNLMSEELLAKMITNEKGQRTRIASLHLLLGADDLSAKIETLENLRQNSLQIFNNMTREFVLDYLTGTTFYSDQNADYEIFLAILNGEDSDVPSGGNIIPFNETVQ